MARAKWGRVVVLPWLLASGVVACGTKASPGDPLASVPEVPESSDPDAGAVGEIDVQSGSGRPDAGASRARLVAVVADAPGAGAQDAGPEAPTCAPEAGRDEPDDAFVDSNCDGIDGDESAAVFVAPTGADTASGAKASPVQTLARGIELAAAKGKSVYVCNGEYAENLVISKAVVSVYGGYDCDAGWKRVPGRAVVKPLAGVALTIDAAPGPIVIDRLSLRAASAAKASDSSIAVVVTGTDDARFVHDEIIAGDGADGEPGAVLPAPRWEAQAPAADGKDVDGAVGCRVDASGAPASSNPAGCALIFMGGAAPSRACPSGDRVQGGLGGFGANRALGVMAGSGGTGTPAGTPGIDGAAGKPGAGATSGFGTAANGRYVATNGGADGEAGHAGHAGHGGGGGLSFFSSDALGSPFVVGAGGGQGGFPGCAGVGGKGGGAGGASIGILSDGRTISLAQVEVFTGRGGHGGAGSSGTSGQPGGHGGRGGYGVTRVAGGTASMDDGAPGTSGGDGGAGGDGGSGAGGPSIGVVFGAIAHLDHVDFYLGRPGSGGRAPASVAPDGLGQETYSLLAPAKAVP